MALNDNYEEIIKEEIRKTQLYFLAIRSNLYKEFFGLIDEFIHKIQPQRAGSRAMTNNGGYFTTSVCKFFMSLFGADESYCD